MMRYEHIMARCKGSYHDHCQDAIFYKEDSDRICAIVADGLGSRAKSDYGSKLICRLVGNLLLKTSNVSGDMLTESINKWYSIIEAKGEDHDDFCTTCSFVMIDKVSKRFIVGNIGDSPIFYQVDGGTVFTTKKDKDFSNVTECVGLDMKERFDLLSGHYSDLIRVLISSDGFGEDLNTNNLDDMFRYLIDKYSTWSSQKKSYHFREEITTCMNEVNTDDKSAIFIWSNL